MIINENMNDGKKKLKQILDNYHGNNGYNNRRTNRCHFDTTVLSNHRKYLKHKIQSLESVNKSSTLYYELPVNNGFSLFTIKSPNPRSKEISKSKRRINSNQSSKGFKHFDRSSECSMIPSQLNEYLESNYNHRSVHRKSIASNDHHHYAVAIAFEISTRSPTKKQPPSSSTLKSKKSSKPKKQSKNSLAKPSTSSSGSSSKSMSKRGLIDGND
ncbi:hypothetical protein BLA29_001393, partial [Euroglyphus maynei]